MVSRVVKLVILEKLGMMNFRFEVTDVQKKLGDLFVHYGKVLSGFVKNKDNVEMKINEK